LTFLYKHLFLCLFQIKERHSGEKIDKGSNYNEDPTGQRTGNRPDHNMVDILTRTVQDLEDYIDKVINCDRRVYPAQSHIYI
jgi:hypothetical protein